MNIFGKEIKPEVATMWVNIAGFVASMIFYLSVEHSFIKPAEIPQNPLQDTLVKIDTKLTGELKQLKEQQDSLVQVIHTHEEQVAQTQTQVQKEKVKIITTLHTEWDTLTHQQKEAYTNQLISKLKKKSP